MIEHLIRYTALVALASVSLPGLSRTQDTPASVDARAGRPLLTRDGEGPGKRQLPAMAYDSVGDRIVVFGGDLVRRDARTYAWQRDQWQVIADSGPVFRDDMAFAGFGAAGALVMFGGQTEVRDATGRMRQRLLGETWVLRGAQWHLADTAGPSVRNHAVGAYDPVRRRFVVFGGSARTAPGAARQLLEDTWEWDGSRWHERAIPGPPGRMGFAMAYDATARMIVLHGGFRSGVALTDTWGFDGTSWRLLGTEGPRALYGAAGTAPRGGIVLFGGHRMSDPSSAETFHWDGKTWRTVATAGPSARTFNAFAADTRRGRLYLLGGVDDWWYLTADFRWVNISGGR